MGLIVARCRTRYMGIVQTTGGNLWMSEWAQGWTDHSRSITSPAFPLLAVSPSMSTGLAMPDNLDQVVSGNVIDNIINLFFDYVYPLTPCLHRPSFIANLTARRDRTDPVFFALTLTVIASTLVQVPRSCVNLDKQEIESLVRRCVRVARAKVAYIFEVGRK